MDTTKIIAEEIQREKEIAESNFRDLIRQKLRNIATLQQAVKKHQDALDLAKKELKEVKMEEFDSSIYQ